MKGVWYKGDHMHVCKQAPSIWQMLHEATFINKRKKLNAVLRAAYNKLKMEKQALTDHLLYRLMQTFVIKLQLILF